MRLGMADPAPTETVRTATSATSIEANNSSTVFDRLRSGIDLGVAELTDAHASPHSAPICVTARVATLPV